LDRTGGRVVEIVNEAEQAMPALRKLLDGLSDYFATAKKQMPAFFRSQETAFPGAKQVAAKMDQALAAAEAGLGGVQVVRNGRKIEAAVLAKTEQPVSTAVLLVSLIPRAAKKG
jgi:hypothetical protein